MKRVIRSIATMMLAFIFVMTSVITASAYMSPEQTSATQNSVTVSWAAVPGTHHYLLYYYPDGSPIDWNTYVEVSGSTTSCSIPILYSKKYHVEAVAYDAYGNKLDWSYYTTPVCPAPGSITTVKSIGWSTDGNYGDFKMSSDPYPDLPYAYEWQLRTKNGKTVKASGTSSYDRFRAKAPSNQVYQLWVRGYSYNGSNKFYGPWDRKTIVPEPKLKQSRFVLGNRIRLSWRKVSGATKYVVYGSTSPNKGYKKIATVKKSKGTYVVSRVKGKKLKKNKYYYFQVQAVSGKFKSYNNTYLRCKIY